MSRSTAMTIRLEPELKSRLGKLSEVTHRSKFFLAAEAVREFIELNERQIQTIKQQLKMPTPVISPVIRRSGDQDCFCKMG